MIGHTMGDDMKAVRFHQFGSSDTLVLEDVPVPVPAAGQVRIAVAGSAFNPVDAGIRGGYLRDVFPVQLPHTPGVDVAGTVDAVGPDVTSVGVGDAVVGFLPMQADGSAAEYVIAPADVLTPAPRNLALARAAALPSVALTAWQSLVEQAHLEQGQRVLINGAGGAVGSYATQIAKGLDAYVIATASPRSDARVRAAGADVVVDHTATQVTDALTEPVDVLLNLANVAPRELAELTAHVRDGGVVVNTVPTVPVAGDDDRGVRGTTVFVVSNAATLKRLVQMVDRGELRVDVAELLPLSELAGVHARADAGQLSGKVVVAP